jgi:hypothetical protein
MPAMGTLWAGVVVCNGEVSAKTIQPHQSRCQAHYLVRANDQQLWQHFWGCMHAFSTIETPTATGCMPLTTMARYMPFESQVHLCMCCCL